jgi:Cdc6-like AAA superfamily ATPase
MALLVALQTKAAQMRIVHPIGSSVRGLSELIGRFRTTILRIDAGRGGVSSARRWYEPMPDSSAPALRRRDGTMPDSRTFVQRSYRTGKAEAPWRVAQAPSPAAIPGQGSPLAPRPGETTKGVQLAAVPRPFDPAPREPEAIAAAKLQPAAGAGAGAGEAEEAFFTLAAPGASWRRGRQVPNAAPAISGLVRDTFTPTRPKRTAELFFGRSQQLRRVIAAIEEERAHVMIYGERGSGKTSLANVLAEKACDAGYMVLRFACSAETAFEDISRSFLRQMPASLVRGDTSRDTLDQLLPAQSGLFELALLFKRIAGKHVILIIDEYDRVISEDAKGKLAELIKHLAGAPVTLVMIGLAETVDQLLGKHPSLQRAILAVPMPLMTWQEVDGIIAAGEMKSGLRFDAAARRAIADFAQGLPYHAQLLCLFAAHSAARRRSSRVEREDLRYAIQCSVDRAEARIKQAYDMAIGRRENASFGEVLFYAARCGTDDFGSFAAADVVIAAARSSTKAPSLLSLQYALKKLTGPERGSVLRRVLRPGGWRYQFSSQMLRHYVLCRAALRHGLI